MQKVFSFDSGVPESKDASSKLDTKGLWKKFTDWLSEEVDAMDGVTTYAVRFRAADDEESYSDEDLCVYAILTPSSSEVSDEESGLEEESEPATKTIHVELQRPGGADKKDIGDVEYASNSKSVIEAIIDYATKLAEINKFPKFDTKRPIVSVKPVKKEELHASRVFNATLRKISTDSETLVDLISISANYSPSQCLTDLNTVLDDQEFFESIPEDCDYSICCISDEGCPEIEIQEGVIPDTTLTYGDALWQCLTYCVAAWGNAKHVLSNLSGSESGEFKVLLSSATYLLSDMFEEISELSLELCGSCPNILTLPLQNCSLLAGTSYEDANCAWTALKPCVDDIIQALDLYYCNFSHDIQARFDYWIRALKRWELQMGRCI